MTNSGTDNRPVIFDYRTVPSYLTDIYEWRRRTAPDFSVRRATAKLYRCSPALVTRVLQGKRKLTVDRVPAFARLFELTPEEERYLRDWVHADDGRARQPFASGKPPPLPRRRKSQNHLLSDWLNVYVKDAARLRGFVPEAASLHRLLGGIAPLHRLKKALEFLFREGFLRRTLDGKIVENDVLVTTTDEELDRRLQALHRRALEIARNHIRRYPLARRRESLVVLPLNETSLNEMKLLLKDFYEKLLAFAEEHPQDDEGLYQVIINLSPIGGIPHVKKPA